MRLVWTDVHEDLVDHMLALDTREEHKLIIDSSGRFALSLEESALQTCVGDEFEFNRSMLVLIWTVQKKSKGKMNRKIPIAIRHERK